MTCDGHRDRDLKLETRAREGTDSEQKLRCPACGLTFRR